MNGANTTYFKNKFQLTYPLKNERVFHGYTPNGLQIYINPQTRDQFIPTLSGELLYKSGNPYEINGVQIVAGQIRYPLRFWENNSQIVTVKARTVKEMQEWYKEWYDETLIVQPPLRQFDFNWATATPQERESFFETRSPMQRGKLHQYIGTTLQGQSEAMSEKIVNGKMEKVLLNPLDHPHTNEVVSEIVPQEVLKVQIDYHNFYAYAGSGLRRFAELHPAHTAAGHTGGLFVLNDYEAKQCALTFLVAAALNADLLMIV